MVGNAAVISNTPLARIATTEGPATSGRQTRPASAPENPSAGNVSEALSLTAPAMRTILAPSPDSATERQGHASLSAAGVFSSAGSWLRTSTITMAATASAAISSNPPVKLPVASLIQPMA